LGKQLHRLPNIDTGTIAHVGLDKASPTYSLHSSNIVKPTDREVNADFAKEHRIYLLTAIPLPKSMLLTRMLSNLQSTNVHPTEVKVLSRAFEKFSA
jgi:hypothetical protein